MHFITLDLQLTFLMTFVIVFRILVIYDIITYFISNIVYTYMLCDPYTISALFFLIIGSAMILPYN